MTRPTRQGGVSQDGSLVAYDADADFTNQRWHAVVRTSTGVAVAGAAARILGIVQDNPPQGLPATVKTRDTSKAVAGGTFAAGAALTTDASGRLVVAATSNPIVAYAEEAGAANRIVSVRLDRNGGVA